jgi:hypothetical protein
MGSRRCFSSNPRQVDKGRDKAGAVGPHEAARTAGVVGTVPWRSDSDMASVWRGRNGKCGRYNGLACAWALNADRVGSAASMQRWVGPFQVASGQWSSVACTAPRGLARLTLFQIYKDFQIDFKCSTCNI